MIFVCLILRRCSISFLKTFNISLHSSVEHSVISEFVIGCSITLTCDGSTYKIISINTYVNLCICVYISCIYVCSYTHMYTAHILQYRKNQETKILKVSLDENYLQELFLQLHNCYACAYVPMCSICTCQFTKSMHLLHTYTYMQSYVLVCICMYVHIYQRYIKLIHCYKCSLVMNRHVLLKLPVMLNIFHEGNIFFLLSYFN